MDAVKIDMLVRVERVSGWCSRFRRRAVEGKRFGAQSRSTTTIAEFMYILYLIKAAAITHYWMWPFTCLRCRGAAGSSARGWKPPSERFAGMLALLPSGRSFLASGLCV